jgi:hypothetical protein
VCINTIINDYVHRKRGGSVALVGVTPNSTGVSDHTFNNSIAIDRYHLTCQAAVCALTPAWFIPSSP